MELPKGVEWAAHTLLVLHVAGGERAHSSVALAGVFELSPTYLNKHLQKLAAAGLVTSVPGAGGGFRLARAAEEITLHDVVTALGAAQPIFRCTEIRCQGAFADKKSAIQAQGICAVNRAMGKAEDAWRTSLRATSIAELAAGLDNDSRARIRSALASGRTRADAPRTRTD